MSDPAPNDAPVLPPVVSAAQDAVRAAAACDLTDPVNGRRLLKAMKALQVVREAFASSADEFDMAADSMNTPSYLAPVGYAPANEDDLLPSLGMGFNRAQRPNAPETFASRVVREALAVIPEFLAQGRVRVEADRARAVSTLAYDVGEALKHGDTVTADLVRKELTRMVETAPEPTTGAAALAAYRSLNSLPPETRTTAFAVAGAVQGALKDDPDAAAELANAVGRLTL